jgi:hypothetical protein
VNYAVSGSKPGNNRESPSEMPLLLILRSLSGQRDRCP